MTARQPKSRKKIIRIGLDFDGVVAYNPVRVVRPYVAFIKYHVFGIRKLRFLVPKNKWVRLFWIIAHESSFFPARGVELFRELANRDDVEFYLITARYSFLDASLYRWLDRWKLRNFFRGVYVNTHNKQPHVHKLEVITALHLDYFIEDNWDIVHYLQHKTPTKVCWIYNIGDRKKKYAYKYPYLQKALESLHV